MSALKSDLLGVVESTYGIIEELINFEKDCKDPGCYDLVQRYDQILHSNGEYLKEADIGEILEDQYVGTFDRDGLVSLRDKFLEIYTNDEIKSCDFSAVNEYLSDNFAEGSIAYTQEILNSLLFVGTFCYEVVLKANDLIEQIPTDDLPTDDLKVVIDATDTDRSDLLWVMEALYRGSEPEAIKSVLKKDITEILGLNFGDKYPADQFLTSESKNLELTRLGHNTVLYSYRDDPSELSNA